MAYQREVIKFTKTSIDAKATGATTIFTTDNGTERFYPLFAIIESTAASGVLSVALVSIGTNSTSFNDILPITTLTGISAANKMISLPLSVAAATSVAPNTAIKINVTTGATGTSQNIKATIVGYYE